MEERLDKILIERGLLSTRTQAEQIIREVGVKVNGKLITKTGKKFPSNSTIVMIEDEIPWVSRRALKLIEAIDRWNPKIMGGVIIDIAASTGGFTEVLLSKDVKKVFCVDIETNQLHPKIKSDERIVNLEKTHVRELTNKLITEECDGCVIDISSISLEKIFPFIHSFILPNGFMIASIKPQFEVSKEKLGKGGIIKNKQLYPQVIERLKIVASQNHLHYVDHIDSPILGSDGNKEFLMLFKKI
jgi:23S rRNA (cytidine1920-2'-O)/16S rRNA (cytidine1409-2'-O)-methyltransferase